VPEGGEDRLGRRGMIEGLISTILLEEPEVIAVTGAYGEGKTSFLNLAVGELRKLEGDDRPIIVRFSPWLAGDSNALVLSLLNSIVVELKGRFVVPGLGRDASRYARTLLSAIPKAEWLKDFIESPSQGQRIDAMAGHIARTRRRILVVLDDLDRMEARELETVFKLLRGSDRLSNITFLCAYSPSELAQILKATRPSQNTSIFIEKFFPVRYSLPPVDPSLLRDFFRAENRCFCYSLCALSP
jgi:predicted KAP-like P-loop ATPase